MPQLIISAADIRDNSILIQDARFRHIKSLRIKPGEQLRFTDGRGTGYTGVLKQLSRHKAVFEILNTLDRDNERSGIILAQSITKKDRMSFAVQKATELGVDAVIPFTSRYTVVKVKEKNFSNRYESVINDAVSQCMRSVIPQFHEAVDYKNLIKGMPEVYKVLFHYGEAAGAISALFDTIKESRQVMLIIGPEGGFSGDEIEFALANNVPVARLGRNILRSETAAIAAISIVSFIRGQ